MLGTNSLPPTPESTLLGQGDQGPLQHSLVTGGVLAVWTALGQVMQLGLVTSVGQVIIVVTHGSCADCLKLSQSSKSLLASQ